MWNDIYGRALTEPWQIISIDEIGCDSEVSYIDSDGKEHTVDFDGKVQLSIDGKKHYENRYGVRHDKPNIVLLPGQECELLFFKDTSMIPSGATNKGCTDDTPKHSLFPSVNCFMRITRYKIIVGGESEFLLNWDDKPVSDEATEYVHDTKTMTSLLHLITKQSNEQKKLRHRLYDMLKEEF